MYDGYEKPRQICVVATSSSGTQSIRISNNNYTHAVIYVDKSDGWWNGQVYASFHRRKDLAERKLREMTKWYVSMDREVPAMEVVETKEVRVSEGRKLKRLLKLKAIEQDVTVALSEAVSG